MQIMIDTAVDSPAQIYKFATFLAAMFETVPVAPGDASINSDGSDKEPIILHDKEPVKVEEKPSNVLPLFPVQDTPPPPPPPPGPAPVEVDQHGTQYDPAIHSSSKKLTLDGRWKARRNVAKDEAPAAPLVTGGTAPAPAPTPPPPPPPPPAAPSGAGTPAPLSTPLPPPVLVPPAPLTPPPPPPDDDEDDAGPPPPTAAGMDFPTFITHVTTGMSNGSLTQKRIDEVLQKNGIESLFALNSRPDLLVAVCTDFGFAA